jgi:hypothetical protein
MSGRYFTNTRAFEDQDWNDLSRNRTFQPNEYWIVWPEGSTGQPEAGEEGWREATEEEFGRFYDDPSAVTHVIAATSVIHSRAQCNKCFERIPLGEEYRFTENGVDYVWCKECLPNALPGCQHCGDDHKEGDCPNPRTTALSARLIPRLGT